MISILLSSERTSLVIVFSAWPMNHTFGLYGKEPKVGHRNDDCSKLCALPDKDKQDCKEARSTPYFGLSAA